jgi:integrase
VRNPIKLIGPEKIEPYQGIHWLESREAQAALQRIERSTLLGKRDYALFIVLLKSGRRLSEVASLRWQHASSRAGASRSRLSTARAIRPCAIRSRLANSRAVLAWLHAHYGAELSRLDKNAPLWVTLSRNSKQAGRPLGIQGIQQICQKYLEEHTHVTRHTFTYLMIKSGVTLSEIQARLGHESLATTGIYARVLTSDENPHTEKLDTLLGIE